MSFIYKSLLPTPEEIRAEFPLKPELAKMKAEKDKEIAAVFTGDSDKFVVIIGPCSADREDAVCEYMGRLARVNEKVKDKLLIIPRVYTNKPRTTGGGYKGMLHQPDPEKKPNMYEGLVAIRKLHMRVIQDYGFTTADEMLYPENLSYLSDVLSYIAIGARSVENQQHRLASSGVDVPVGMKNPTSGDLSVMLNAVYAAQQDDAYTGTRSRTLPPSSIHIGAFSAFPRMSHSAMSMPAMASKRMPPERPLSVFLMVSQCFVTDSGSWPIRVGASSPSISAAYACAPKRASDSPTP